MHVRVEHDYPGHFGCSLALKLFSMNALLFNFFLKSWFLFTIEMTELVLASYWTSNILGTFNQKSVFIFVLFFCSSLLLALCSQKGWDVPSAFYPNKFWVKDTFEPK